MEEKNEGLSEDAASKVSELALRMLAPEGRANPQPLYREMRKLCPVMPTPGGFGGASILGHEEVQYALRHPEIFSSNMEAVNIGNKYPLIPLQIDPPDHVKYRKLLDPLFSRKKMLQLDPEIRQLANQLIDRFIDKGECEFDKDFAIPFPCTVFLHLMGLPLDELDLFLELKDGIIRPDTTDPGERDKLVNATGERIHAYFEQAIEDRMKRRDEGLLSLFLDAEVDGNKLSRTEIHGICYLFLLGGLDTVTATLGCGISYLAQHPEQRQKLVENPALMHSAIEELLRWESPVGGVIRIATRDVTIGGVEIKAGETVGINLGSADVDDVGFPHADQVDFARKVNPHFAFGGGVHKCLGSHLARLEIRVAFSEIHRRIPVYSIKPGETPQYSLAIREVQYLPLVFGTRDQANV